MNTAAQMNPNTSGMQLSGETLYLAFRAAYLSTLEALRSELREGFAFGRPFLDCIPLLSGCAPQVQIDHLLQTWNHLSTGPTAVPNAIHQCVCYAAVHLLGQLGETENRRRLNEAAEGPTPVPRLDPLWLASKVRLLQITWPVRLSAPDFLCESHLISDNLDATEKPLLAPQVRQSLLEIVGAWRVSPSILSNGTGLLTEAEKHQLGSLLQKHPDLLDL